MGSQGGPDLIRSIEFSFYGINDNQSLLLFLDKVISMIIDH